MCDRVLFGLRRFSCCTGSHCSCDASLSLAFISHCFLSTLFLSAGRRQKGDWREAGATTDLCVCVCVSQRCWEGCRRSLVSVLCFVFVYLSLKKKELDIERRFSAFLWAVSLIIITFFFRNQGMESEAAERSATWYQVQVLLTPRVGSTFFFSMRESACQQRRLHFSMTTTSVCVCACLTERKIRIHTSLVFPAQHGASLKIGFLNMLQPLTAPLPIPPPPCFFSFFPPYCSSFWTVGEHSFLHSDIVEVLPFSFPPPLLSLSSL